jgi:hypothetical protein
MTAPETAGPVLAARFRPYVGDFNRSLKSRIA